MSTISSGLKVSYLSSYKSASALVALSVNLYVPIWPDVFDGNYEEILCDFYVTDP